MIDKRAPLPWVEVQDQPRRGARENENGASGAVLSTQTPQKPPDTTTTASRDHTVICPHPGQKHDTFNNAYHTKNTTTNTAFDKNHMSEVTTESAGLAPRSAAPRQSIRLTLDAARRKGSPLTYRALGRIQPLNSLRGQRLKATIKYHSVQIHNSTQKII
jgi:DNA segregation ATPase FtsK/SpoIIIE-like protein